MEQRYQLFKSDLNFDANNTPSTGISNYHSTNSHSNQQIGIHNWNKQFPKWKQILGKFIFFLFFTTLLLQATLLWQAYYSFFNKVIENV